jgi:hypothetical protein
MGNKKITIKTTARTTSTGNVRVSTSVNSGHGTRTTTKTIRVK